MAFFAESGLVASGTKQPEKMRLCSKCGRRLEENEPGIFSCPRGHGEWREGIFSTQVHHSNSNGETFLGGAVGHGKSSKGRNRKKPQRRQTSISKKYLSPYP